MQLNATQLQVRKDFLWVQRLFIASWGVWVPVFLIFLHDLFPRTPGYVETVVCVSFVFAAALEVPTGVYADRMSGYRTFQWAGWVFLLSNLVYCAAIALDAEADRLKLALAAEFLSAVALAFYSGSFDKWYTTVLEQARVVRSSQEGFRLFRGERNLLFLGAGVVGIALYGFLRARGDLIGATAAHWLLLPHLWAAGFVAAALVVASRAQGRLSDAGTPKAGGVLSQDAGGAALDNLLVFSQAWSFVFRIPSLFSITIVQAAIQVQVTYCAFYVSRDVASTGPEGSEYWQNVVAAVAFVAYWVLGRTLRVVGNRYRPSVLAGMRSETILLALSASYVAAAVLLLEFAEPVLGTVSSPAVLLTGLLSFYVIGVVEVKLDAEAADIAPRDLMATVFSVRSMVANLGAALVFPFGTLLADSVPEAFAPVTLMGVLAAACAVICGFAVVAPRGAEWTVGTRTGLWSVLTGGAAVAVAMAWWWPVAEQDIASVVRLLSSSGATVRLVDGGPFAPVKVVHGVIVGWAVASGMVGLACLYNGPNSVATPGDRARIALLVAAFRSHWLLHTQVLRPIGQGIRLLEAGDRASTLKVLALADARLRQLIAPDAASESGGGDRLMAAVFRLLVNRTAVKSTEEFRAACAAGAGEWASREQEGHWRVRVELAGGWPGAERDARWWEPAADGQREWDRLDVSAPEVDSALGDALSNAIDAIHRRQATRSGEGMVRINVVSTSMGFWVYVVDDGDGLGGDTHQEHELKSVRSGRLGLVAAGILTRAGRLGYYLDDGPSGGAVVRLWLPRPAPPTAAEEA